MSLDPDSIFRIWKHSVVQKYFKMTKQDSGLCFSVLIGTTGVTAIAVWEVL